MLNVNDRIAIWILFAILVGAPSPNGAATLRGVVVDGSPSPSGDNGIHSVKITITYNDRGEGDERNVQLTQTDKKGRFGMERLAPGRILIGFSKPGYRPRSGKQEYDLTNEIHVIRLELYQVNPEDPETYHRNLARRLEREAAGDIGYYRTAFQHLEEIGLARESRSATLEYLAEFVSPKDYATVRKSLSEYPEQWRGNQLHIEDQVVPARTVTGIATLDDGSALPGVTVTITDSIGLVRMAITDETGRYRFLDVRPGEYWVMGNLNEEFRSIQIPIQVSDARGVQVNLVMIPVESSKTKVG